MPDLLRFLVMPAGIGFVLLLAAIGLLALRRYRAALLAGVGAFGLVWVAALPPVADWLIGRLEDDFPEVAVEQLPMADCAILLGGMAKPSRRFGADASRIPAGGRLDRTAQLFHAGKVSHVIISAGGAAGGPPGETEADRAHDLLVDAGIPTERILLDRTSRSTRENALHSSDLAGRIGCRRALLVTSAAHMPRAMATFGGVGMDVWPVVATSRTELDAQQSLSPFWPNRDALGETHRALHEWYGLVYYALRGWLSRG